MSEQRKNSKTEPTTFYVISAEDFGRVAERITARNAFLAAQHALMADSGDVMIVVNEKFVSQFQAVKTVQQVRGKDVVVSDD